MLRKPITPTEIWSYRLRGKEENGTPGSELPDRFGHLSVCVTHVSGTTCHLSLGPLAARWRRVIAT